MPGTRERPLSPHLQIYRLPLNAILSISHRLTGMVLALGTALLAVMLILAAAGPDAYNGPYAVASHWLGKIVMFGFTAALYFHLCAGVRHLVWDVGYGYSLEAARRGSYAVLGAAAVLTVVTWLIALSI